MKRPAISERMKIDALLNVSHNVGLIPHGILCGYCHRAVLAEQPIEWDHFVPLAIGGIHHWSNLRPLHFACHRNKTSGSGSTTAGSDIGKISKERRIIRTQKMAVKKRVVLCFPGDPDLELGVVPMDLPKRKWPKRKLEGRPFPQRRAP